MFCDNNTDILHTLDNLFSPRPCDPLQIRGYVFLVKPTSYTCRGIIDTYQIGYSMNEGINNATDKGDIQRIFMCTDPVKVSEDIKSQFRTLLKYSPYDITCFFKGDIKMIIDIFNRVAAKYIPNNLGYFPQVAELQKEFPNFMDDISLVGFKRLVKISTSNTTLVYTERGKIKTIDYSKYLTGTCSRQFFKNLYETILCKQVIHDISTNKFLNDVYKIKTYVIPNTTVPVIKQLAEKYDKVNINKGNSNSKSLHNTTHHYVVNNLLKNGYIKYGRHLIDCTVEKHPTNLRYVTVTVDSCGIPGPFETHTFTFEIKNGYYHQINDIVLPDDSSISDDEF